MTSLVILLCLVAASCAAATSASLLEETLHGSNDLSDALVQDSRLKQSFRRLAAEPSDDHFKTDHDVSADGELPSSKVLMRSLLTTVEGTAAKATPQPRIERLRWRVSRAQLQAVRLGGEGNSSQMQCYRGGTPRPAACPTFSSCGPGFPGFQACSDLEFRDPKVEPYPWHRYKNRFQYPGICTPGYELQPNVTASFDCPDPTLLTPQEWSGQVFLLRNVYVNRLGQVFNRTHYFDTGGCFSSTKFEYPSGFKVRKFERLVNLIVPPSPSPALSLATLLPLTFLLRNLLPSIKANATPVALGDIKTHKVPLKYFNGLRLVGPEPDGEDSEALFHVDTLVQPLHPGCLAPSRSLWQRLRSSHLLPPSGLPLFNSSTWTERTVPGAPPPGSPPPAAQLERDEWVVILVRPRNVEEKLADFPWLEGRIRDAFGQRVVVYGPNHLPLAEAKSLFNRAALLVSLSSSSALSNVIFLPNGAFVLELQHPTVPGFSPPVLTPSVPFFLHTLGIRALAHSTGLHHSLFVLGPSGRAGKGDVIADQAEFLILLRRIHQGIYSSYQGLLAGLPHPGATPDTATTPVPAGPAFSPPSSVRAFDTWMRCIASTGKWVPDLTPRVLPWEFANTLSYCDLKWHAKGHVIGWEADAKVVSGQVSPEDWDPRPELKWKWAVDEAKCGPWETFDSDKLCQQIRPRGLSVVLVGDSLTRNFMASLTGLLSREQRLKHLKRGPPYPAARSTPWALNRTIPGQCAEWMRHAGEEEAEKWREYTSCVQFDPMDGFCPGLRLYSMRNDMLMLDTDPKTYDYVPWMRSDAVANADVIVLNTGAHHYSDAVHERNVRAAANFVRHNFPDKLLVYRATAAGHVRCDDYEGPIDEPQDLSSVHPAWGWTRFGYENERAKRIMDGVGGLFMDVERMTALRPDGHNGFVKETNVTDCLHYCTPGPLDVWSQMLYNILLRYLAAGASTGSGKDS